MPAYDPGPTLRGAIASVLGQSLSDLELLLIDDGSEEDIAPYLPSDPRLRVIRHRRNRGYAAATATGIAAATGRWVTFVDADDAIDPSYLEQMTSTARRTGAAVVMAPLMTVHPDGTTGQLAWDPPAGPTGSGRDAIRRILQGRLIASQHLLLERAQPRHPRTAPNTFSDLLFLVSNLAHVDQVAYEPRALYRYSIHPGSVTGSLRESVWDLGRLPAQLEPELEHAFPADEAATLLRCAQVLALTQMLHKAALEPRPTALRAEVTRWCRHRITPAVLTAAVRTGQHRSAAELLLARISPAAHRRAYRAHLRRGSAAP
ncbi:glycosyltransferase [Brachybacterium sp. p3-SID1565]|uniref:glycosyltransferase family 2 protein n=1 Tax=Brachybacterium sp. p3-SID1565 TaxID=2916046 RepID=UPI0021A4D6DE|nr:glycosyltransferase family 2 protein [Brachybacterium sp. p3-SID1565]MCT1385828.1 glycosyltransferase [Brachybacterium sp. p3-SID1565]